MLKGQDILNSTKKIARHEAAPLLALVALLLYVDQRYCEPLPHNTVHIRLTKQTREFFTTLEQKLHTAFFPSTNHPGNSLRLVHAAQGLAHKPKRHVEHQVVTEKIVSEKSSPVDADNERTGTSHPPAEVYETDPKLVYENITGLPKPAPLTAPTPPR